MNQRIEYIDLAKGMCILLVVFTHLIGYYSYSFNHSACLTIFRMPLYFFLSGMFFKSYEGVVGFLKRKTNKLLIPFLSFYLLTSVLMPNLLSLVGFEVRNAESLGFQSLYAFITVEKFSNMPIWFLLCLFNVNVVFYLLYMLFNPNTKTYNVYVLGGVSCVLGCIGYYLGYYNFNLPMFLDSVLTAMPFFFFGYAFNKHTSFMRENSLDKYSWLLIVLFYSIVYLWAGEVGYAANEFGDTSVLCVYSCGLLGTLATILVAKKIKYLPIVSYCGRYSIIILLTHNVVIPFVRMIVGRFGLSFACEVTLIFTIIILLSRFVIIPLLRKICPHITAQKDIIRVSQYWAG